ncbi:Mycothiol acetyltransferase [Nocardioides dokdonensis FR1436]|uniref:Mycothiol acetyltransferase n=1 Tax=Nocardioides dokdonensis FR1436 TaxID=1300347 RepID=A0A1A9GL24_9ACTN|nr:GNAT family N-acetyltransferase [Nocardioides dokdonensis]ANH39047.1 Mycothiol acetyltransferase [Nocardioides dokdonensis FR1436]
MSSPTADVSVRVAWADDAAAIAALQLRAWPVMYADLVPAEVLPSGPEALESVAAAWTQALARPADARHRTLVALERNRVVGFAITTPATDPDCDPVSVGELTELVLDPDERGKGHGSRLQQAAVDTLRSDRFTRAVTWAVASDDGLRRFLVEAGWDTDGAHRELDLDGTGAVTLKQVRLHTSLAETDDVHP